MGVENSPLGRYIQTNSNRRVYPARLSEEDFAITDIARGLSHVCRFAGQIEEFYSVAEHSVRGSYPAEVAFGPKIAYEFLLHDAAEAFMGDLASPFLASCTDYQLLRDRMQATINSRFVIPQGKSVECHEVDVRMLVTEARDLCHEDNKWWLEPHFPKPYPNKTYLIGPIGRDTRAISMPGSRFWYPNKAREKFMERFFELQEKVLNAATTGKSHAVERATVGVS